ncbi:hypothetical protein CAC42_173 [Sphaceloma murrayae]|uniref:Uncharacterized protein n=1 Tax=Sphaceloma murrayae TaxID=2082308 RepID=A0A2K1QNF2_9PEZI|nr:hypothetical protein CAC42_173 [Sphaceloma murrayae]
MGLRAPDASGAYPTDQTIATSPPPTAQQPPNNTTTTATNPQLPPAAIDLAGKLFDLAREGNTAALTQYLDAGIPPNLTNHKGDTLLMLAAYHGHAATTRILLEKGADPNVLNDRGQSIIAGAVFKGYDDVVAVLFEGVDGRPPRADIRLGQPNAVDCASMFGHEKYLELFGVEGTGPRPWENASGTT